MKENIFINRFFTNAIETYINNKQTENNPVFSSFPVMVIRALIYIYGELDIINPYRTRNENRMGGFDSNMTKYGFSHEKLEDLKSSLEKFSVTENENKKPNIYFLKIQKYLIDMFCLKLKDQGSTNLNQTDFEKYLYLSTNLNPEMQKDLERFVFAKNELDLYLKSKIFEMNHNFTLLPFKRNTLFPEAYTIFGYSLETISEMDEQTLNNLNYQIMNFFKIDASEPDKQTRLKEAVTYYKKYGNAMTSGNGYVDMLLLLSVIATVMMTLFAITVKVLG